MANLGWDRDQVFSASRLGYGEDSGMKPKGIQEQLEARFLDFIMGFRFSGEFYYREQLIANIKRKYYGIDLILEHLISFDAHLAQSLQDEPNDHLLAFETALGKAAKQVQASQKELAESGEGEELILPSRLPQFQVVLRSTTTLQHVRDLNSDYISRMIKVTGIIISASSLSSKAIGLFIRCRNCGHTKTLPIGQGITGVQLPRSCDGQSMETNDKCPMDPYVIDHDRSTFVDMQTLKLQEAPDMVPVGELPKHLLISADRCLVNQVVPGTRATIIGIYSTFQSGSKRNNIGAATRTPYIRMVGLESEVSGLNRGVTSFTDAEISELESLPRSPDFYEKFARSIAPAIYGSSDIKKAITALLFGGSLKRLPDGMRLRGDINVLMLGDPSTAKSQLLKFTEKVAPISVYTSGKGSSAAGLTASVVRDPGSREFYLEGGAMVLADGGVVCIDEFDKMRDEDRVAIHEAMEQQTISIAKAGITTMLNSRTSVLAAANPIFGRYDDLRSPGDNIDFQATILSRFDLIFIVRDIYDPQRDMAIAKHVMNVHLARSARNSNEKNGSNGLEGNNYREFTANGEDVFDINTMKRYIAFARSRCSPRLSKEAAEELANHFVDLRAQVKRIEEETKTRSAIPITIRQLEAVVRLSEALAKMTLSPLATVEHVNEALRLFKVSTMDAIQGDGSIAPFGANIQPQMAQIEREILRILPIGHTISMAKLQRELLATGADLGLIERAVLVMVRQGILAFRNLRSNIHRLSTSAS